ncbi:hypothetical protein ACFVRD_15295 [Streptomyces sp. NPDC057908]|uniref:hypothetical protein n=1 Tax=Streptomyces sp. NPDC057908 TaxID=3346276 RepID=UPI0036EE13DD
MNDELDILLTALYVKIDDELETNRWMGGLPKLTDAEVVTLAVAHALLGFHSEARWLRYARRHLAPVFPYLPQQSGYNNRLKTALPAPDRAVPGRWWTRWQHAPVVRQWLCRRSVSRRAPPSNRADTRKHEHSGHVTECLFEPIRGIGRGRSGGRGRPDRPPPCG